MGSIATGSAGVFDEPVNLKAAVQKPRELHIAQWSQGLPEGSTEHCFSASKNSTSSETAASSTPKRSWLGWLGNCRLSINDSRLEFWSGGSPRVRENGASQGDCATWGYEVGVTSEYKSSGASTVVVTASRIAPIEDWVRVGADEETKFTMRARGFSGLAFAPFGCAGVPRSLAFGSRDRRRATRSAINLA